MESPSDDHGEEQPALWSTKEEHCKTLGIIREYTRLCSTDGGLPALKITKEAPPNLQMTEEGDHKLSG